MNDIEIVIENTHERRTVPQGVSLAQLAQDYYLELGRWPLQFPVLGALVNNVVEDMRYCIFRPKVVRFFDVNDFQGSRMYQASLVFMLYKAVRDTYPEARLKVRHTIQGGFYCTIDFPGPQDRVAVAKAVRDRMVDLQHQDLPFESKTLLKSDAEDQMRGMNNAEALRLIGLSDQLYVSMSYLGGEVQRISSKLVPSTGCLTSWDFRTYADEGYVLHLPDSKHFDKLSILPDTPKLFSIFSEHQHWAELLHVPTVSDLNRLVRDKHENQLIHVSEALHEKKYAEIADQIFQRRGQVRMVLLAGPSSSGKTTSCRRLSVQLSVLGFDVQQLSLDDFFVSRDRTPKLPNGEFDFESLDTLDVPLLNDCLLRLSKGERVEIPSFDFVKGEPRFDGKFMQMNANSILVMEGIHALNPRLTADIPDELKFRVYVSALTQIAVDDLNIIHSSENRMLRRIVRDNNFRGWNAYQTIHQWPEVRRGEERNIFPYQEKADVMFNSALLYELGVLKTFAEPLLKQVPQNCEEYAEAHHLLTFLDLIDPIGTKAIPPTSIMREFLGGSSFDY